MAFTNYIRAGYPILWVQTYEEYRALATFCRDLSLITKEHYLPHTWDIVDGIRPISVSNGNLSFGQPLAVAAPTGDAFGGGPVPPEPMDPLNWLEKMAEDNTVVFLKDYHASLKDPVLLRKIRNVLPKFKSCGKSLVIISPVLEIPRELEKEVTVVSFDLPTRDELKIVLKGACESSEAKYPTNDEELLDSALGMTALEAENAFSVSLVEKRKFDAAIVRREKASIVKKTGILEVIDSPLTLDDIGGLENLKEWLISRKDCFSEAARNFGVKPPRALLLLGVPGTGKSLTAKVVSNVRGCPLLKLDMGSIFDKYVGETEAKLRQVFKIAEAVAPCVLWIDELEKSFSSGQDSHEVSKKVLAGFLTWMNDHTADVYVVATANAAHTLPPEFLNRFEKSFWVDLPDAVQREEIIGIHIKKAGRSLKSFNTKELVRVTEGFNGREIEAWVKEAVSVAFSRGHKDLLDEDLLDTARDVSPISRMMEASIKSSRDWAKARNVKHASKDHTVAEGPEEQRKRKINTDA